MCVTVRPALGAAGLGQWGQRKIIVGEGMDGRTDDGGFTLNFGMYTVHKPGRRHAQEPNGTPVHADDERHDAHEVLGESKRVEECQ